MKDLKFTFLIVIITIILNIVGFAGKDTVFAHVDVQRGSMPYMANVFLAMNGAVDMSSFGGDMYADAGSEEDENMNGLVSDEEGDFHNLNPDGSFAKKTMDAQNALIDPSGEDDGTDTSDDDEEEDDEDSDEDSDEDGSDEPKIPGPVTEDYLDDALFIGDSRVKGLDQYGDIEGATFYSNVGINIMKLFTKRFCETPQGTTDLESALKQRQFGKIYLEVGINEIGTGDTEYFIGFYQNAIDRIRELQPEAIIYIQGIIRVTKNKENKTFSNTRINERNEALKALADNESIFYLEVNDALSTEDGYLNSEYSFDGVHMYAQYYYLWKDYILSNGV